MFRSVDPIESCEDEVSYCQQVSGPTQLDHTLIVAI
jgi:hypothetical protein